MQNKNNFNFYKNIYLSFIIYYYNKLIIKNKIMNYYNRTKNSILESINISDNIAVLITQYAVDQKYTIDHMSYSDEMQTIIVDNIDIDFFYDNHSYESLEKKQSIDNIAELITKFTLAKHIIFSTTKIKEETKQNKEKRIAEYVKSLIYTIESIRKKIEECEDDYNSRRINNILNIMNKEEIIFLYFKNLTQKLDFLNIDPAQIFEMLNFYFKQYSKDIYTLYYIDDDPECKNFKDTIKYFCNKISKKCGLVVDDDKDSSCCCSIM